MRNVDAIETKNSELRCEAETNRSYFVANVEREQTPEGRRLPSCSAFDYHGSGKMKKLELGNASTSAASVALALDRVADFAASVVIAVSEPVRAAGRMYRYRRTVAELSRLDDHGLKDIGLHRSQIEPLANEFSKRFSSMRPPL